MTRSPRRVLGLLSSALASVLLLSGCSVYDLPLPGGADVGSNPLHLKVVFRDVLDLVPQSTVKVNDVTVGKVSAIKLKGYVAEVDIVVPKDTDLPENTVATIRQTSLLGEKFVSLAPPKDPSSDKLEDGDTIGLDRSGRNPEVEEVLGALSLLLNGGGIAQLKTIADELNTALGGREEDVRSVIEQIKSFMGQLDTNKESIVAAIENTNRLAKQLNEQDASIKSALDNLPQALASIDRQRADLVKLLKALNRLSDVGVRVIRDSKRSTINSLRDLAPVLENLAAAGQDFPDSFQVLLTYPFVDAAVGNDPQVARNLHMGDFTNLSARLDLDLSTLNLPETPTIPIPPPVAQLCKAARKALIDNSIRIINNLPLGPRQKERLRNAVRDTVAALNCDQVGATQAKDLVAALIDKLIPGVVGALCDTVPRNPVCRLLTTPGGLPPIQLPGVPGLPNLPGLGLGLNRAEPGPGYRAPQADDPFGLSPHGVDPTLGTLLLQGVATRR